MVCVYRPKVMAVCPMTLYLYTCNGLLSLLIGERA